MVDRRARFGYDAALHFVRADAMIRFRCSGCDSLVQVRDELAGARVRCQRCEEVLTVPTESAAAGDAASAHAAAANAPAPVEAPSSRPESDAPPGPAWRSRRELADDADRPRPGRGRRNDDVGLGLILGVAGGAALLLGGVVAILVWLLPGRTAPTRPPFGRPGMPVGGFDKAMDPFPVMKDGMKGEIILDKGPMFFDKDGPRRGGPPFRPPGGPGDPPVFDPDFAPPGAFQPPPKRFADVKK
jgi:hypothetical protein